MKSGFRNNCSIWGSVGRAGILLLALSAISTAVADAVNAIECTPTIYGTAYDGPDDPAIFYAIDITDGSGTQVGPTGFDRISAMDFDPTSGILYAIAERHDDNQKVLISIDRLTGVGTEIAEVLLSLETAKEHIAGMSFNSSGTLYGMGSWEQGFYTIDVSNGTVVRLGKLNAGSAAYGNGAAFSPSDVLYYVGNEDLNTVDLSTGFPTLVTGLIYTFLVDPNGISAMDYSPETGLYYAILKDDLGETHLTTINVETGEVDQVGFTADNMDGMAYFCEPVIISDLVFEDGFESP